jgi:hypothetical protein
MRGTSQPAASHYVLLDMSCAWLTSSETGAGAGGGVSCHALSCGTWVLNLSAMAGGHLLGANMGFVFVLRSTFCTCPTGHARRMSAG